MRNELLRKGEAIVRVLKTEGNKHLIIDCLKRSMPQWVPETDLHRWEPCEEDTLPSADVPTLDALTAEQRRVMHERYTMIAPVITFIHNEALRSSMISQMAELNGVSKQTIRRYLCSFLAYQKIEVLAPIPNHKPKELTSDEKNFRWALNRYFYTQRQHKLPTVYSLMLKDKYTDAVGQLVEGYPSFHRFKYFYQKTRKTQSELISRNGISNYQRNSRPLLGTVHDFAQSIGVGLLDSTTCDIYLISDSGQLVGRPVLTLCVDAYSSLVCGYHLSWEGGVFSLQQLMENVVTGSAEICRRFGLDIPEESWPCTGFLPGVLVTDKGREYTGATFEQITELGVRMINLPPYRPELKGIVEHAFSLIQDYYKPHLKGKGVIMPDFQERGSVDYRKSACLTIDDFEKVLLRCIAYYNSSRILGSPAYTQEMLDAGVEPTAAAVWRWAYTQAGANLIPVDAVHLKRTLLPRTEGKFTRRGLIVHKQRYRHCEGNFTEHYLTGGSVTVAYNPDNISEVFVLMDGLYTRFELILKVYDSLSLEEVQAMQSQEQAVKKAAQAKKDQAMVDLVSSIETIANGCVRQSDVGLKNIRQTRKTEKQRRKLGGDT